MRRLVAAIAVALFGIVVGAQSAQASHSWNGYHWARKTNPFTVQLVDATTYDGQLGQAAVDWSASAVLDTTITTKCSSKKCVDVLNANYGPTFWSGLATIWVDRNKHIVAGRVQLNDYYTVPRGAAYADFVMCQEVGHTLGLAHQDEAFSNPNLGTCMDYTSDPTRNDGAGTNLQPNAHDYEQLVTIYNHRDKGRGVNGPAVGSITFVIPV